MAHLAGRVGVLKSMLTPQSVLEADEERAAALKAGTTPIGQTQDRQRYRLSGVIRSVVITPRGAGPGFGVELFDGTAQLDLIWLGQRQVLGLEPGRHLIVEGLVTVQGDGRRVMRNPRYELVPLGTGL